MNPTGDECSMKGLASKKKELRQEMLRSRRQLPEIQRKSHSENIFSELTKDERLREFQFVHCFVGQSEEPDTLPILRWMLNQGKKVAVPCVDSDKVELQHSLILSTDVLEIGKFGILDVRPEKRIEVNISDLDLVLVPGIAFDLSGGRLGYGRGYYDRFLKKTEGFRVGVCYESQIVDQVPMEAHDIHMQALISQKGFQDLS